MQNPLIILMTIVLWNEKFNLACSVHSYKKVSALNFLVASLLCLTTKPFFIVMETTTSILAFHPKLFKIVNHVIQHKYDAENTTADASGKNSFALHKRY